ncbi:histidine phosphatase family protein [Geminocystis sp. NIES-3709]|uniref:histidine phosphatase family protein n=1 Tax=Geminocystis sp. NIES-3709 TaxID=1617448 RepID=UPI0005FC6AC2|nr:histidine phosphatase family protein [Geminocystis sp. NIES-3709]BAQ63760.1 expressed protein [Geminocystis sp. NIES-3709]
MASIIWVARHGHRFDFAYPEWFNTALRRYDPPLSEEGKIQAQNLGINLKNEVIDHLIVSPFLRTIQTAHIIADIINLPLKLEPGLGEWHNPHWMTEKPLTHPPEELRLFYPRIDWNYRSTITPIYPETEAMVLERMKETAQILIRKFSGNLLLIGHSISVIGITKALVGEKKEIKPDFCSITKIYI